MKSSSRTTHPVLLFINLYFFSFQEPSFFLYFFTLREGFTAVVPLCAEMITTRSNFVFQTKRGPFPSTFSNSNTPPPVLTIFSRCPTTTRTEWHFFIISRSFVYSRTCHLQLLQNILCFQTCTFPKWKQPTLWSRHLLYFPIGQDWRISSN